MLCFPSEIYGDSNPNSHECKTESRRVFVIIGFLGSNPDHHFISPTLGVHLPGLTRTLTWGINVTPSEVNPLRQQMRFFVSQVRRVTPNKGLCDLHSKPRAA